MYRTQLTNICWKTTHLCEAAKTKPQKLVYDVMAVISKFTDTDKFVDNTRLYTACIIHVFF